MDLEERAERGTKVAWSNESLELLLDGCVVIWAFQDGFAVLDTCLSMSQVTNSELPRMKSKWSELVPSWSRKNNCFC